MSLTNQVRNVYGSWGRTRSPKQLSPNVPADYANTKRSAALSEVTKVAAITNLSNTLAGTNAGENGYVTQNQRFLHVVVSAANNKAVDIYVYHYATQLWAPLMIHDGNGSTYSVAQAKTASSGTAALQPQAFIFDISGADRVAFVTSDTLTIHASCTTF